VCAYDLALHVHALCSVESIQHSKNLHTDHVHIELGEINHEKESKGTEGLVLTDGDGEYLENDSSISS
jgi:hypothetical protein